MKEYSSTVLILCGCLWITSELDISGQEGDLCTHIYKVVTIPLNHSKMLVLEWFIEQDNRSLRVSIVDLSNGSLLSLPWIKAS